MSTKRQVNDFVRRHWRVSVKTICFHMYTEKRKMEGEDNLSSGTVGTLFPATFPPPETTPWVGLRRATKKNPLKFWTLPTACPMRRWRARRCGVLYDAGVRRWSTRNILARLGPTYFWVTRTFRKSSRTLSGRRCWHRPSPRRPYHWSGGSAESSRRAKRTRSPALRISPTVAADAAAAEAVAVARARVPPVRPVRPAATTRTRYRKRGKTPVAVTTAR